MFTFQGVGGAAIKHQEEVLYIRQGALLLVLHSCSTVSWSVCFKTRANKSILPFGCQIYSLEVDVAHKGKELHRDGKEPYFTRGRNVHSKKLYIQEFF